MKTLSLLPAVFGLGLAVPAPSQPQPFVPIDPQRAQDQETMTWADTGQCRARRGPTPPYRGSGPA